MKPEELAEGSVERFAAPGDRAVEDTELVQTSDEMEMEGEPEVVKLAGQVKRALAPVKAPSAVRNRLRVELLEVARYQQRQDVRLESPSHRRGWAIGAAIGSAVALVSGALYLLRSRVSGRDPGAES